MMTAFVLLAALLALLVTAYIVLPLLRQGAVQTPGSPYAAIGVMAVMLLGGAALYAVLSNFDWTRSAQPAAADSPETMVASLARRLNREPNDLNGWLMLGRSYAALRQYPLALRAYDRANRLADGRNAEALEGFAEALVLQNPDELRGRGRQLFEKALELDPTSGKALFFSGAAAMQNGELKIARERFSRLLDLGPPDNIKPILQQQIAAIDAEMAKGDGVGPASAMPGGAQPAAASSGANAKVSVRIALAARIDAQGLEESPLFVFVREPGVPGPPLAVKRLPSRFPADVSLSADDAMMAGRAIEAGKTVEVTARVSRGGTPTAAAGDPFGVVRYDVGKDGVKDLVIDQVTP
jgi:cytochrome c-type biogenesis protein CcmH